MLLYGYDREIALWVGKRTGIDDFGPSRAVAIARDDKIIFGIVYHSWREGNIEVTIAAEDPRWCRRDNLKALFGYPFFQLCCRRMTSIIKADNERSLKLCQGLGFKIEGCCREVFGPVDGIVLGMLRSECKWI